MTDDRKPINPFRVPGVGPKATLRPLDHAEHGKYYVDVGNTEDAFNEFTLKMDIDTTLQHDGQLVLVAGESGCGKTALINRCAWYVRERLTDRKLDWYVADLHECLVGEQVVGDERFARVQQALIADLQGEGLLLDDAFEKLKPYQSNPKGLYRVLHRYLRERTVLIVLLPPSDLPNHAIIYGALKAPRMLFLAEFHYTTYAEKHVKDIESVLESTTTPPIVLRLGGLRPGDLKRFSKDRLKRHQEVGIYPRMADEIAETFDQRWPTVKLMQSVLYDVFEVRMKNGLGYDESVVLDLKDVARSHKYPEPGRGQE